MQVTEEMIRNKAYELWEASGKLSGSAEDDWFAAQKQLLETAGKTSSLQNQSPPNGLRQLSTT